LGILIFLALFLQRNTYSLNRKSQTSGNRGTESFGSYKMDGRAAWIITEGIRRVARQQSGFLF
jgi:hypothetical protein